MIRFFCCPLTRCSVFTNCPKLCMMHSSHFRKKITSNINKIYLHGSPITPIIEPINHLIKKFVVYSTKILGCVQIKIYIFRAIFPPKFPLKQLRIAQLSTFKQTIPRVLTTHTHSTQTKRPSLTTTHGSE